MIGAAMLRTGTYEEVEADTSATKQAMLVVVLVSLASGIGNVGVGGVPALVFGLLAALAGWSFWAWITYVVGTKILPTPETHANWGQLARTLGYAQTPGLFKVFARDWPYYLHRDHLAVDRRDYRDQAGPGLHVHPAGNRGCGYRVHRLRRRDRNSDGDIRVPDYTRLITTD
jgi:hypothetical protein